MRKKGLFICILLISCLIFNGCGKSVELSYAEKMILIYAGIDVEEAKNSKLTKEEKTILNQFEFAKSYFVDKYGNSEDITFTCVVPINENQNYTYFACHLTADAAATFEIDVYNNGNNFEAKDNYWGVLVNEEYCELISTIISECGCNVKETEIYLSDTVSNEYDQNFTIKDAILNNKMISGYGTIILNNISDENDTINEIEKKFRENGIIGKFAIEMEMSDELYWIEIK